MAVHLEGTAIVDLKSTPGLAAIAPFALQGFANVVITSNNFAKNNVLTVKPGGGGDGNKKLGAVGVRAGVSHG